MPSDLVYTPAAGHHWLTPVYDFGVAALTREHRWRSALIKQVRPRAGDVIADIGCGTGSVLVRLGNAAPSAQIGRASCRGRVCQYVYVSVVSGTLKNKKKLK